MPAALFSRCDPSKKVQIVTYVIWQGEGDTVTATVLEGSPGQVVIEKIEGDGGRLSLTAADNCIGIAAIETLKLMGKVSCGVSLRLTKVCYSVPCHFLLAILPFETRKEYCIV